MKEKIKIGYIGLGKRGQSVLKNNFALMKDVEVAMVCDKLASRIREGVQFVRELGGYTPKTTLDYHDILNAPDIDAVVIMTGWEGRAAMAQESMRAGKYTAIEVGCSDTLQECFDLVKTYEETRVPVMMLENCCYGRREMMVLNMVKQGLFGEPVHCSGGYLHDITEEDLFRFLIKNEEQVHYRIGYYERMNRENYPTHELGPISKVLNINRGNRFISLNSISSKSVGLKAYTKERFGENSEYAKKEYKQGDIVNTILTCANGETVLLTLDTTLPRSHYSRGFSVRGTRGMSLEEKKVIYLKGMEENAENNEEEMYKLYEHPLYRDYLAEGVQLGHGGIDWLVCRAFTESVKADIQTPIDAYDTATWMAIGALSEASIKAGGAPVDFPDFTNGKWKDREPITESKYCLDRVCVDPSVKVVP